MKCEHIFELDTKAKAPKNPDEFRIICEKCGLKRKAKDGDVFKAVIDMTNVIHCTTE